MKVWNAHMWPSCLRCCMHTKLSFETPTATAPT